MPAELFLGDDAKQIAPLSNKPSSNSHATPQRRNEKQTAKPTSNIYQTSLFELRPGKQG
jgi:hypothetical protein